ncbi:hypothetical protein SD71_13710 [Cohnella kolymensis]|uniref:Uncharacterized protein n=1 Tax=Cohnella kolymensis TaxID=1590652 RepID=A0ABR5A418_9BACL|nr:hypothetical protein [Cohnella kolymensis]KIL35373.1 hypothetical protein SD71_13710 [Cohnella kolymensis]
MGFKRKLTSIALSIGLLFGTISSVSAATTPFQDQDFWKEVQDLHGELMNDEPEKVRLARDTIKRLDDTHQWENIWGDALDNLKLETTLETRPNGEVISDQDLFFQLLSEVGGLVYSSDGSTLEAIRTDRTYNALLQEIANEAVQAKVGDLKVDDFVEFVFAVQAAVRNNVTDLNNVIQLENAARVVLADTSLKLVRVFNELYPDRTQKAELALAIYKFLNYETVDAQGNKKNTDIRWRKGLI